LIESYIEVIAILKNNYFRVLTIMCVMNTTCGHMCFSLFTWMVRKWMIIQHWKCLYTNW